LSEDKKEEIRKDIEKNTQGHCQELPEVKFSKKQIDRLVSRLKLYVDAIEEADTKIRRCKEKLGLSHNPDGEGVEPYATGTE